MTKCNCEPCGDHCSCRCHERKDSLRADGGSRSPDLIGDDPAISTELR